MIEDIWKGKTVFIKGFWGWRPETWAAVGFSGNRRDTFIDEATDPFIMAVYVTLNSSGAPKEIRGKIVGFYLVSHTKGHRNEFTAPIHYQLEPDKWQNALKAVRAFSFLPEYQPNVYDFDPSLKQGSQGKAYNGVKLTPEKIEKLESIPYKEVPVYNGDSVIDETIHVPDSTKNQVRGGPVNRSGYYVEGEPIDTEKELYSLILSGDTKAFLGEKASELQIYKIGLSISPKTRLSSFQKTLPESLPQGNIGWVQHRSTRLDEHAPYPNFEAAIAGEKAMKNYLGKHGEWLGGEFYAATKEHFETAWKLGREAALNYLVNNGVIQ
jgi:hypothetical protein